MRAYNATDSSTNALDTDIVTLDMAVFDRLFVMSQLGLRRGPTGVRISSQGRGARGDRVKPSAGICRTAAALAARSLEDTMDTP
jgi:hypothetical protein